MPKHSITIVVDDSSHDYLQILAQGIWQEFQDELAIVEMKKDGLTKSEKAASNLAQKHGSAVVYLLRALATRKTKTLYLRVVNGSIQIGKR